MQYFWKKFPANELYKGSSLRKSLFDLIRADFPDFSEDSHISIEELNKYRKKYLELIVLSERGELSQLDQQSSKPSIKINCSPAMSL